METLRNTVTGYVNNQTRQSQNDYQMFHCIMNSLTEEGHLKILTEQDKYHIGAANDRTPSGPLLFKLLMQKAIIDTRATSSLLRENLSSPDTYMATIKSNIKEFNEYVKQNYEGLLAPRAYQYSQGKKRFSQMIQMIFLLWKIQLKINRKKPPRAMRVT
jgi:hypothetical protein